MTGGQPVDDGTLRVPEITRELEAEGVKKIVVVTDEPEKYDGVKTLAPGVTVHHRDELDAIQRAVSRDRRLHRDRLRPDLRDREAPPPQARHDGATDHAPSSSTSWCAKAAATAR